MNPKRRWIFLVSAILACGVVAAAHSGYLHGTIGAIATLPGWLVVIDFFRGYDYSRSPEWVYGVAGLVSCGFWILLIGPLVASPRRMRRLAAMVSVLVVVPVGYLAFRTTEFQRDNGELYRFHRSWGFITRVTLDANADGRVDDETWYTWHEPFLDVHASRPEHGRSDKNLDGRWDTWIDYSASRLQIDLDGDEIADETLTADWHGFQEARKMRGY